MFTEQEFLQANSDKKLNSFDYLHAVMTCEKVPLDFLKSMFKFYDPDLTLYDDGIFLTECFDLDKLNELIDSGKNAKEASYWINLLDLTSVFDSYDYEVIKSFGEQVLSSWNRKLSYLYPSRGFQANLIEDTELNEIYLTIS